MILIDSSAWIEFLRDNAPMAATVDAVIEFDHATCAVIRMELLAGARTESELTQIPRLLARARLLPISEGHYDQAAQIYRTCRAAGEIPRSMADCLIAAVAIHKGAALLARDRDFEVISRHCALVLR